MFRYINFILLSTSLLCLDAYAGGEKSNNNSARDSQSTSGHNVNSLLKAAEEGDPTAMFELGYCYQFGLGTAKNKSTADLWFKKTALFASADDIGKISKKHKDSTTYDILTCYCNEKAAEKGNVEAMFISGYYYYYGIGVDENNSAAQKYIEQAARSASADDINKIHKKYSYLYAARNALMFYSYKHGAEKGDPEAMFKLGNCYQFGIGTAKNKSTADLWFKKTALFASADDIGKISKKADRQTESYKKLKFYYYKQGAEKDNPETMFNLAFCYCYGIGTDIDKLAAEQLILAVCKIANKDDLDKEIQKRAGYEYYTKLLTKCMINPDINMNFSREIPEIIARSGPQRVNEFTDSLGWE